MKIYRLLVLFFLLYIIFINYITYVSEQQINYWYIVPSVALIGSFFISNKKLIFITINIASLSFIALTSFNITNLVMMIIFCVLINYFVFADA